MLQGIAKLEADGVSYLAKGSFKISVGGKKNEPIMGETRINGFKTVVIEPYIEGTITAHDGFNLKEFIAIKNATIVLTTDGGAVYNWKDAKYTGEGSMTADEGEVPFRFTSEEEAEIL